MDRSARFAILVAAAMAAAAFGLGGCVTINTPKAPVTTPPAENTVPAEKPASGIAVGDSVAAVWTDGNRYLATVTAVDGDQITVKYTDDGSSRAVASADVTPIVKKTWVVGDKVAAVWSSGRFYAGSVVESSEDKYMIKWDDGSQPSEVIADKIIAR